MVKEDRSDWVAVDPEFQSNGQEHAPITKALTPFQFYQKHAMPQVKADLQAANAGTELGSVMKEMSKRWKNMPAKEKSKFNKLAEEDKQRFQSESQARDKAIEESRRLKREAAAATAHGKRERKSHQIPREATAKRAPRQRSAREEKHRKEKQELKAEEARQKEELANKKSEIASARLQYLLSQSDIFAHFSGSVNTKTDKSKKRTSEEEDEQLSTQPSLVRLTHQPSVIQHGQMRAYQLEGLSWMVNLAHQGINGILADEMGLGKTLQTISVLGYFHEYENISGPHIVLVPKTTLSNWLNEFRKWCPSLRTIKFHGDKAERTRVANEILLPGISAEERKFDVCVTTFEMLLKEKALLGKFAWRYLVIDEAHRIKNEASLFSTAVRQLETQHRLLLTGTPLQNNLHELWALLNFLLPDVFASSQEFDEWFNLDVDDEEAKKQMITQLHKILRPFMLRRLKADVERTLPPKKETLLFVGMSAMQKKLYKSLLLRDMATITNGAQGVSKSALQNIVMQLRKCCGHPYLFEGQEDRNLDPLGDHVIENCGKMVLLDKLLTKLRERGSRVLIFTQMTRVLDILEDFCRMRQYGYCRIDGQTTYEVRENSIEEFNAPDSSKFLFLLSTRAGGLGINLYTADVVILYDSDWNPQSDLQAQDRAHRIGQKKEVNVYRLITSDSVEEKIVERAQQKLKLDAMVVQQGRLQDKQNKLSKSDMLDMIKFGADQVFRATDSNVTDEDIDAILAKGEQRTEEMQKKLQAHDKGNLLDFKLEGGGVQNHDGVDYSNERAREEELKRLADAELAKAMVEGGGKRERRTAARAPVLPKDEKKNASNLLPKNLRLPRMDEWQFYNRKRLVELHEMEAAAYEEARKESEKPDPHAPYLPRDLLEEKQRLLSEAFEWNKPAYFLFVKLLARYGRQDLESISREMGKPLDEIQRYAKVFFDRGPTELSDWPRLLKSIEKGESKLLEIARLTKATADKINRYSNPWEDMPVHFQGKGGKGFTEDEDRILLCLVHQHGYGAWERIKSEIERLEMFAFDYYLRSRTTVEIGRRCDSLMRMCERDNADMEAREKKDMETQVALSKQRSELDKKLRKARDELKKSQKKVDDMIMKEARKMQRQRELKRQNKRQRDHDSEDEKVERHVQELANFVQRADSEDAAKLAMDFCALTQEQDGEELQPPYVLKRIRAMAEPMEDLRDGRIVWRIKEEEFTTPVPSDSEEKASKVAKKDSGEDASSCQASSKQEDGSRLPRSPWSPSAMKQQDAKAEKKKAKKQSRPRSAYVLFSVHMRQEIKDELGSDATMMDVMKTLLDRWQQMTPEEKKPWEDRAEQEERQFQREEKA